MNSVDPIADARDMMARGALTHAGRVLEYLFEHGDRSFEVLVQLTRCHLLLEQRPRARRYLALAEASNRRSPRVACYRGWLALLDGDHREALSMLTQCLSRHPRCAETYLVRGLCHQAAGDLPRAIADFDRAAIDLRDDVTLRLSRGTAYERSGELELALRDFETAGALAPDAVEPRLCAGRVQARMDRHEAALAEYDLAIELDHTSVDAWLGSADVFAARGRWSEVLRCLGAAAAVAPDASTVHARTGRVLVELGHFEPGARHLDRALRDLPDDDELKVSRAVAAYHLDDTETCCELCAEAIDRHPEYRLARIYRALAQLQLGIESEASVRTELEAATELEAKHPRAPLALAEALAASGEMGIAVELVSTAVRLDPRVADQLHASDKLARLLDVERYAARIARARAESASSSSPPRPSH